jgi:hypothetical protein
MSDEGFISSSLTPKIRKIGNMIIAYSASRGTGQLMHFANYPEPRLDNLEAYLRIDFCDAIQKASEMFKIDINTKENGADILVGVDGRLFDITTEDWSVSEYDYTAQGSGYAYAIGSLHATSKLDIPPRKRIQMAISASIKHSPECASPIDVMSI